MPVTAVRLIYKLCIMAVKTRERDVQTHLTLSVIGMTLNKCHTWPLLSSLMLRNKAGLLITTAQEDYEEIHTCNFPKQ